MGAQTSLVFSQTNLSLSNWSGYDTGKNRWFFQSMVETLMKVATLGISKFIHQRDIADSYGQDAIFEYYAIDPFNDVNWFSYTPYPHHLVQQWSDKINVLIGKDDGKLGYFTSNENVLGIVISKDTLQFRSRMACTINADQYFPMVVYRKYSENIKMMAWVDTWSYLSNISVGNFWANNADLESNELVLPMVDNELSCSPELCSSSVELYSYIVGSNYVYRDIQFRETKFSSIKWHIPNDCR